MKSGTGGVTLRSTLTCPACGEQTAETMSTDACHHVYECPKCRVILKPKPVDCCVFCSYGDVACPPVQQAGGFIRLTEL